MDCWTNNLVRQSIFYEIDFKLQCIMIAFNKESGFY